MPVLLLGWSSRKCNLLNLFYEAPLLSFVSSSSLYSAVGTNSTSAVNSDQSSFRLIVGQIANDTNLKLHTYMKRGDIILPNLVQTSTNEAHAW